MTRTTAAILAALALGAAAACGRAPDPPGVEPPPLPVAEPAAPGGFTPGPCQDGSLDAQLACLATIEPAFAGVAVDERGLIIFLTDLSRLASAEQLLPLVYGRSLDAHGHARGVLVRYGWGKLFEWRTRAAALFGAFGGVIELDIDELANRVRVGVLDGTDTSAVADALRSMGLPDDGFEVAMVEPVEFAG